MEDLQATPLYIIFDGPPSHESGRFVEVETITGQSVGLAHYWSKRPDALWQLGPFFVVPQPAPRDTEITQLRRSLAYAQSEAERLKIEWRMYAGVCEERDRLRVAYNSLAAMVKGKDKEHADTQARLAEVSAQMRAVVVTLDRAGVLRESTCDGAELTEVLPWNRVKWVLEERGRLRAEVERLRQGLWDCFAAVGGDTDGDATPAAIASDLVALVWETVRATRAYHDAENERLHERLQHWADEAANQNVEVGRLTAELAERDATIADMQKSSV